MLATVENVLPVFLLIFAGWIVVRTGYIESAVGDAVSEFVFKLAVPVMLFRTIAKADFHGAFPVRLWIAYFSAVAVTWAIAYTLAFRLFGSDRRLATVTGISSSFANTVFIGLPLVDRTVGPEGLVALSILLAVHLPVMMVASSLLIEHAEKLDTGKERESWGQFIRSVLRNLFRNPLVFGILGGGLWNEAGLPLSGIPGIVVEQVSAIAGPAALLAIGMATRRYGFRGLGPVGAMTTLLKLIVMPALVLAFATLIGLREEWRAALVLIAGVPTGVNAWLIARQFQSGEPLAASTITLTTGLGVLTVTFWAYIVG